MGRPPTGITFIARVRIPKPDWDAMEIAAALIGPDRSKLINEFVGMVLRDPAAWRDARRVATARGDAMVDVVLRALRSYVARNRDLLPVTLPPAEAQKPDVERPSS